MIQLGSDLFYPRIIALWLDLQDDDDQDILSVRQPHEVESVRVAYQTSLDESFIPLNAWLHKAWKNFRRRSSLEVLLRLMRLPLDDREVIYDWIMENIHIFLNLEPFSEGN